MAWFLRALVRERQEPTGPIESELEALVSAHHRVDPRGEDAAHCALCAHACEVLGRESERRELLARTTKGKATRESLLRVQRLLRLSRRSDPHGEPLRTVSLLLVPNHAH